MGFETCVIGIDVGGTNTDAVVLKGRRVLSYGKQLTTNDVTTGVINALYVALKNCPEKDILLQQINIGTTHFVNAVVQRSKDLSKVVVLRLAKPPCTEAMPPFNDFPRSLREIVEGDWRQLHGGYEFDGRELCSIDEQEIVKVVGEYMKNGLRHFVLSCVFSTVKNDHENQARQCIMSNFPQASVTCSYELGHIGILERENAGVLNECLKELASRTLSNLQSAIAHDLGLTCPLYLTQNDGTICSIDQAMQFPVLTFASGPTNSMRGAAFLSGIKNALVVDIGGTSTDVGALKDGFPKQANSKVYVGGVPTFFRMPHMYSIGLGGGSLVRRQGDAVAVGPDSVGYRLATQAICFGGQTLTATDIAVASDQADDILPVSPEALGRAVSEELAESVLVMIKEKVEAAIDLVKTDKRPEPVVLVGGGAILIDKKARLSGCSDTIRLEHAQIANAIGAALCQVSGFIDVVASVDPSSREARHQALTDAKERAVKAAISNGAAPKSVELVECVEIPLTYLPGNAVQYKIRAVGDLDIGPSKCLVVDTQNFKRMTVPAAGVSEADTPLHRHVSLDKNIAVEDGDIRPEEIIDGCSPFDRNGEWILSTYDIECVEIGAGILGCGGGGSPHAGKIRLVNLMSKGMAPRVVTVDNLMANCSSPDKSVAISVGFMGAPVCFSEKLATNEGTVIAVATMLDTVMNPDKYSHLQRDQYAGGVTYSDNVTVPQDVLEMLHQNVTPDSICQAVIADEVGGANAMEPLAVSAATAIPCADVDCMGRAYPELQMQTSFVYGEPWNPVCQTDEFGRVTVSWTANTAKDMENFHRFICIQNGCKSNLALSAVPVARLKDVCVQGSISRAWKIGRAVLDARAQKTSPVEAVVVTENGKLLLTAKIVDVHRRTEGGFNRGYVILEDLLKTGDEWTVTFQNENLIITRNEAIIVTVPDLICILDSETGDTISTEDLRYGLRVSVVILPPSPLLTTERALPVFGPDAFGLNVPYRPSFS